MKTKLLTPLFFALLFLALSINGNAKPAPAKKIKHVTAAYSMSDLKRNLEYDFAKSSIRITYDNRLEQLANVIKTKNYAIALRGHADAIGTFKGNWVLSQKRADMVKAYLVSKGVPENKIVATAFGSTIPLASNKTAAGRQQNRRVEIKLNGSAE